MKTKNYFEQGLQHLDLSLTDQQKEKLLSFIDILHKWRQHFNLTAVSEQKEMVSRHLLDSLSVARYINSSRVLDVGTGAGIPGIILSIYFPDKQFVLLDSNEKKITFIKHTVKILGLTNVQCVCCRIEAYRPEQNFSTILSRAFAPLQKLIQVTDHLIANKGELLAMTGQDHVNLQQQVLERHMLVKKLVTLNIWGDPIPRQLVILTKEKK